MSTLTNLFNQVLSSGSVPDIWASVKTVVIFKKKGDIHDPANYRNIALFNCITKIYTQILAVRLKCWAESNKIIPDFQSGFREERCCTDNLFSLSAAIQTVINKKSRYVIAIFVDFEKAFDSVIHSKLWHKLISLGESKALQSIMNLYSKLHMQYIINGAESKKMVINKGTPQGVS